MNNAGNNTNSSLGGNPYPEIIAYWNIFHLDELVSTKWIFYTYIDNLSFLGGLLDIILLFPTVIMLGYTFRLNEINVFFHEQLIKNWSHSNGIQTDGKIMDWNNPENSNYTAYSKYILRNYLTISYKILFYVAIKPVRKFWKDLKFKWGKQSQVE